MHDCVSNAFLLIMQLYSQFNYLNVPSFSLFSCSTTESCICINADLDIGAESCASAKLPVPVRKLTRESLIP